MSDCRASTVTAAPSAAGPGRSAAATSSRSASRSCTTQCCGPGSRGASQRPIDPVPQPRSWITRRPAAGSVRREVLDELGARAAASAGSRRASHPGLTRTLRGDHRDAPARTPARTDVVRRPPGERRAPLAGGPAQPAPQLGVAEPGPERGGERRRVAGRDQQARPGPVGAVTEGLRQPADLGRDDRQATGQRLGDDHAVRLGARRQHQQVRGGVAAVEVGSGPRPREAHPVAQAACSERRRSRSTNAGSRSRLPTQTQRHGRSASSPAHRAARRAPCPGSPPRRTAAPRRPRSRLRGRRRRRRARRRAPGRPATRTARAAGAGSTRWS